MLDGLEANTIIAGAYATGDGVCPMLAAHRCGSRTSTIAFAKAWDRFAFGGARRRAARRASERELLILRSYLEVSLLIEDAAEPALGAAHREHLELVMRRGRVAGATRAPAATGATGATGLLESDDRSRHVGQRPGWAWSDVWRGVGDYERVLRLVQAELGSDLEGPVLDPVDPRAFKQAPRTRPQPVARSRRTPRQPALTR